VSDWREQYGRILRFRRRLQWEMLWDEDVFDNCYSFAQACYRLVDWLENDPSQPIRRTQAEEHVAASSVVCTRPLPGPPCAPEPFVIVT
jgi:hypothetical protein